MCPLALILFAFACDGGKGLDGADGVDGADGTNGTDGAPGSDGEDGADGQDGSDGTDGEDGEDAPLDLVVLPGDSFFPESISASSDGTFHVTSIGTGAVYTISADGRTVTSLIPAETSQPYGKLGVFLDEAENDLYVCTLDTSTFASTLRRYDGATASLEAEFPLTNYGVCNDIAMDAAGNVYITDSFFGIQRLAAGASALEIWSTDALYEPSPGGFGIDGIVLDGDSFYVDNLDAGTLIRVPIAGDGTAGTPVAISGVTLTAPDGLRLLAPDTILVAESAADTLSKIVVNRDDDSGVRTVLSNRLDRPAAVAISDGAAWVAEGQVGRLFGLDDTPVNIPFLVVRLPLH